MIRAYQFNELSLQQLYCILQLRQRVFIQEQESIYDDIDGLDADSIHWCDFEGNQLVTYARVRPMNGQTTCKIERVVNHPEHRGKGKGATLMESILKALKGSNQINCIELSAQISVLGFYRGLGFKEFGEAYDDGGIMHKSMQLSL